MMEVIKMNGDRVPFSEEKVRTSIRRTGAAKEVEDRIITEVYESLKSGWTTQELYKFVFERLQKQNVCYACRYSLRDAIMMLGPAGFHFEVYVAAILNEHGFTAENPKNDIQGSCITHEVDVLAEKNGERIMIEAKFRNRIGDYVNSKDTLATWARFLDLQDGAAEGKCEPVDTAWIVTNARFSEHASTYARCKGMKTIGWKSGGELAIEKLIDSRGLYPVTVIDQLTPAELQSFASVNLLLCKDVAKQEPEELAHKLDISLKRAEQLIELSAEVARVR